MVIKFFLEPGNCRGPKLNNWTEFKNLRRFEALFISFFKGPV